MNEMKIKQYVIKKAIKYPRLFNFLKQFRKVTNPKIFSVAISYEQAAKYTKYLAKKIPNNFDIIIGIPRSGLFIADIIATKFGRPLTTPDLFAEGKIWGSNLIKAPKEIKRVLLVDDSVNSGESFIESTKKILKKNPNVIIRRAALISTPNGKKKVDYVFLIKKPKHIFEWQIIQGFKLTKLATDMDGVLCEDCPVGISLVEEEYIKWMKNAKPFMIPTNEIDTIITSRIETYRDITEKWLKENGCKYKKLKMMDLKNDYNKDFEKVISFKIDAIKKSKPELFWESDFRQAVEIHQKSKVPVLCTDEMALLN
jgi:hypoxanthine phosphoribosyltransferase